ncbi:uncharacterized protein LOC114527308 [Dendronephthya gigantea]|uniref:uncharacterized protein LOC114527308 n=1 Tax=Dendronephthya gigantea TaxID=151771 RepID=UPI001069CA03|nr:uncharacterized protein LOC114527308 [Dendronephthya gigantea]
MNVKREEKENEHEMNSYRLTEESNNPIYESVDNDLDVKSNEEQQTLQPGHVYQELENSQNSTSCTTNHEYSTPCDEMMSNSDSPKNSLAFNDTDGLTHFNELYEAS